MDKTNKAGTVELADVFHAFYHTNASLLSVGAGDTELGIKVKRRIGSNEMSEIVDTVCDGVINVETGSFMPELKDYYLRLAVLNAYTDLSLPDNRETWDLVYGTPVFAMVTGHDMRPVTFDGLEYDDNDIIDTEQYDRLLEAIDQKIKYLMAQVTVSDAANAIHDAGWSV